MVLGVVDKADTLVLDHNEKLDSWAVVLNGQVECVLSDQQNTTRTYSVGEHFGVSPVLDEMRHEGVMRTKCDDCQFVLVKQHDYFEILNESKENLKCHYDSQRQVMVTELRALNATTDKTGEIVLRGTADKLLERLVYDEQSTLLDPTFIQDFLLTYRVFIDKPEFITSKLQEWFEKLPSMQQQSQQQQHTSPQTLTQDLHNLSLKKRIYRIVLEWTTNHYNDFETNKDLAAFLEKFQEILSREKMLEQFKVCYIYIYIYIKFVKD